MKIRELLSDPSKWTTLYFARDGNFREVHPLDMSACQWSLIGAMVRCYPNAKERADIILRILDILNIKHIPSWNDDWGRRFEDVKSLVEKLDI